MSDPHPRAFPLEWPPSRPRTPVRQRKTGKFATRTDDGWLHNITVAGACQRLFGEVAWLGGEYPVLSSNLPLTAGGRPRSDLTPVDGEVGVCLYFILKGKQMALACDTYSNVAQNIAALAAHLEAARAIARHGVATAEETLRAFEALPPPAGAGAAGASPSGADGAAGAAGGRPWWQVFGLMRSHATLDAVEALFRAKARRAHPDAPGGDAAAFRELTEALAEAKRDLGAP